MESVRIDKYLWAIRVFKTRSEAAEACRSGKVYVNGAQAKSSRDVKKSDSIEVRKGAVHYKYLVVKSMSATHMGSSLSFTSHLREAVFFLDMTVSKSYVIFSTPLYHSRYLYRYI